jgi:hypothetical protein
MDQDQVIEKLEYSLEETAGEDEKGTAKDFRHQRRSRISAASIWFTIRSPQGRSDPLYPSYAAVVSIFAH